MSITEALLEEHSKENAARIAAYACTSKKTFAELMKLYSGNDVVLAQRAAWSVDKAARIRPDLITPYIGDLVKAIQQKNVHDAVIRNAVRILEELEIPEIYHGEVMNTCFGFIEDPSKPPAIKAFSLTILANLAKHYPEIKAELKLIIEERWDTETPAFKSRGGKILKKM